MQRIKYIDALSSARYSSLFYIPLALSYFELLAFRGENQVSVPIGFYFAYVHFTFSIRVPPPETWTAATLLVLLSSICFAVTGWITGFVCALVYNFFARHFRGLQIEVKMDSSS